MLSGHNTITQHKLFGNTVFTFLPISYTAFWGDKKYVCKYIKISQKLELCWDHFSINQPERGGGLNKDRTVWVDGPKNTFASLQKLIKWSINQQINTGFT
jgi:hypothetical protein